MSYGGGGKGGAPQGPQDNLFIAGLPMEITVEQLQAVFGQYGAIGSCKVLPNNGKPDAAALVRMVDANMAKWMVDNLNGNIPVGLASPLTVRFAQGGGGGYGKAGGKGQDNRFSPYGNTADAFGQVAAVPQQ